mmetsp:Transcript_17002/g.55773  ORF Transcript_17002/g.55773 Transcript_17002/m.55773 type:complete len:205 (+) Transcript_17002:1405-2019(+)
MVGAWIASFSASADWMESTRRASSLKAGAGRSSIALKALAAGCFSALQMTLREGPILASRSPQLPLFSIWSTSRSRFWHMSRTTFFLLARTCSMVRAERLMFRRTATTSTEFSTRVDVTSRPVRGAKQISSSWGYWDTHERSAPRSTMPMLISKIVETDPLDAYCIDTCLFVVVLMKANSTPPQMLCLLGVQNSGGNRPPAMPR